MLRIVLHVNINNAIRFEPENAYETWNLQMHVNVSECTVRFRDGVEVPDYNEC